MPHLPVGRDLRARRLAAFRRVYGSIPVDNFDIVDIVDRIENTHTPPPTHSHTHALHLPPLCLKLSVLKNLHPPSALNTTQSTISNLQSKILSASFPLPLRYERPELRFTLRDGARFAAYLQSLGADATKLLLGDPAVDKPDSPLLKVASQQQWNDPEWWKSENYDLVVMYGRPLESMRALRKGSPDTKLGLKMDSGYGIQVSALPNVRAMIRRYPFYRYVEEYSFIRALAHSIGNIVKNSGPAAIARQKELFSLPHHILYESPMALEETAQWFTTHGVPEYAKKLVLAAHPVPDAFTLPSPSPHTPLPTHPHTPSLSSVPPPSLCLKNQSAQPPQLGPKAYGLTPTPFSVIGVADWTASSKDAPLFAKTMAIVMSEIPDSTLCLAGKGSIALKRRIVTSVPAAESRINASEFVHPNDMPRKMQQAQVYLGTSKCESFGISVAESLCCGCTVALAPGIGVPSYRYFASHGSGTQASSRTPAALAAAVKHEFTRWQSGQFDSATSSAHWSTLCHTSSLIRHICEAAGLSCHQRTPLFQAYAES